MSTFTTIRDKIEHMLAAIFGIIGTIGEHVLAKTGEDIATAAIAGTIHGSDDMINVAKSSLKEQIPDLKNEAAMAVAAIMTHHAADAQAITTPAGE